MQFNRQITKIAREAGKITVQMMKAEGIGSAEFDFIHMVRHHPGITQAEVREALHIDKGAAARRTASLEAKGYLIRKQHPTDSRCQMLYATPAAEQLKTSKARIESCFYDYLSEEFTPEELSDFISKLNRLYLRSKAESRAGFPHIKDRLEEKQ